MSLAAQTPTGQTEIWLACADPQALEQLKIQRFKTNPDNTMMPMSEPWFCKNDTGSLSRLNDKWKHAKQPGFFFLVGEQNPSASANRSMPATQRLWLGQENQNTQGKRADLLPLNALTHEINWLKRLHQSGIKSTAGMGHSTDSTQQSIPAPIAALLVSQQELVWLKDGFRLGNLLPRFSHVLTVATCLTLQFLVAPSEITDQTRQQTNALEKQISAACPYSPPPLDPGKQP